MNQASSQKFIARNRATRVQIEYDVEIYGSKKKVELPFVMGVLADLSGNAGASGQPGDERPPVAERKFLSIDIDSFDDRMKAVRPRATFAVPNQLSGSGHLIVDMTFESIDDFAPGAIARQVAPLARLLEARTQLANLQTYMDGKAGAEGLLNQLLAQPQLMQALSHQPRPDHGADAAGSPLPVTPPAPADAA